MKILLRTLAVGVGFLAACFVGCSAIGAYFALTRMFVGDYVAAIFFLFAAILAARCVQSLWAVSPFWHRRQATAEICAFGFLVMEWPLVANIESHSEGVVRGVIQLTAVAVVVFVYFTTDQVLKARQERKLAA